MFWKHYTFYQPVALISIFFHWQSYESASNLKSSALSFLVLMRAHFTKIQLQLYKCKPLKDLTQSTPQPQRWDTLSYSCQELGETLGLKRLKTQTFINWFPWIYCVCDETETIALIDKIGLTQWRAYKNPTPPTKCILFCHHRSLWLPHHCLKGSVYPLFFAEDGRWEDMWGQMHSWRVSGKCAWECMFVLISIVNAYL